MENPKEKKKILIVDDMKASIDILIKILRKDYALGVAKNAETGVEFAIKNLPDIILMDIKMPGMDGFEACRRLKAIQETKDIPILLISGNLYWAEKVRGVEIGVADYLQKPFLSEEVLMRVRTHLQLSEFMKANNRLIIRSIEFPPEYLQSGLSILNYFGSVLRGKYPDRDATVQIKQDGLKVTMTIDPVAGDRETIEKELVEYGLVVTGKMTPEEYSDDPIAIIKLQNQLDISRIQIESQKRLLQYQDAQIKKKDIRIDKFISLMETALQGDSHINVSVKHGDDIGINGRDVVVAKDRGNAGKST